MVTTKERQIELGALILRGLSTMLPPDDYVTRWDDPMCPRDEWRSYTRHVFSTIGELLSKGPVMPVDKPLTEFAYRLQETTELNSDILAKLNGTNYLALEDGEKMHIAFCLGAVEQEYSKRVEGTRQLAEEIMSRKGTIQVQVDAATEQTIKEMAQHENRSVSNMAATLIQEGIIAIAKRNDESVKR